MPRPRKALISLDETPYYHCIGRCVRRAFLCGEEYEHRREWVRERLFELTRFFAVDVAAYAVMSNHYHLVLHVDREKARLWTPEEVVERWHGLFAGTPISQSFLRGDALIEAERLVLERDAALWRERLMDISWFMRGLNEWIARRANEEDRCTGRFWEGRFKSQALLDEKALAGAMAYIDLNPLRAGMAQTPEESDYTSIQDRIEAAKAADDPEAIDQQPAWLMPFAGNPRDEMPKGLPFRLSDYLELVDWTGRIVREDKRGAISNALPPILERLEIDPKAWLTMSQSFEAQFKGLVGAPDVLKEAGRAIGYQRTPGMAHCRALLN